MQKLNVQEDFIRVSKFLKKQEELNLEDLKDLLIGGKVNLFIPPRLGEMRSLTSSAIEYALAGGVFCAREGVVARIDNYQGVYMDARNYKLNDLFLKKTELTSSTPKAVLQIAPNFEFIIFENKVYPLNNKKQQIIAKYLINDYINSRSGVTRDTYTSDANFPKKGDSYVSQVFTDSAKLFKEAFIEEMPKGKGWILSPKKEIEPIFLVNHPQA